MAAQPHLQPEVNGRHPHTSWTPDPPPPPKLPVRFELPWDPTPHLPLAVCHGRLGILDPRIPRDSVTEKKHPTPGTCGAATPPPSPCVPRGPATSHLPL